jgi:predicted dehydrogenase
VAKRVLSALIVGCGRIAGGHPDDRPDALLSHASAYDRHEGFRMDACIEQDPQRRQAFLTKWKLDKGFPSMAEALAAGGAWDVASICTPTAQHGADLDVLLKADVRAVWCEKPITLSASESEGLVQAYRRAGKPLAVNFLRRWHPAMAGLKAELAAGQWGGILSIAGFYTKGIRNNGSHLIDLIHFLVGPLAVVASVQTRSDYEAHDPTIDALLRTETGVPVHFVTGDARDYSMFELEIVAQRGTIRIEKSGQVIRRRQITDDPDSAGYRILDDGGIVDTGNDDSFVRAAENIYRAVIDGTPLASDGTTALAAEKICDELIRRAQKS